MKIMLVEDSRTMRGLIKVMLKRLGYEDVIEASNGKEAWQYLNKREVDLLLTDWNMPELSGLELLQKVRQEAHLVDLPVIMLTSRNSKEDIVSAVKFGVNNYLIKPCNTSQLKKKIDVVMERGKKEPQAPAERAQQLINNSRKYRDSDWGPYVLAYEAPTDYEEFTQGKSDVLLATYQNLATVIGQLNEQFPGMEMGYWIESDSKEFTRLIKTANEQIGAAIITVHRPESIVLSHFIGLTYPDKVPTFLLCHSPAVLSAEQRANAFKCKQHIVERSQLSVKRMQEILREHLTPEDKVLPSKLRLVEFVEGTGRQPIEGSQVKMHCTGMLEDGSIFDSSHTTGTPLHVVIGQNQIIAGLQESLTHLHQGSRARVVVPPELAYGAKGYGDIIPPDATLIFNVELIEVIPPKK